jgi:hypothetical protein
MHDLSAFGLVQDRTFSRSAAIRQASLARGILHSATHVFVHVLMVLGTYG